MLRSGRRRSRAGSRLGRFDSGLRMISRVGRLSRVGSRFGIRFPGGFVFPDLDRFHFLRNF